MIYIIIIALIAASDLCTKKYINKKYAVGEKKEIIRNNFFLWHVKNSGFSFSKHSGHIKTVVSVAVSFTSAVVAYLLYLLPYKEENLLKLGLAFSAGGSIGNLYERIFKRKVTDFLYIKFKKAPIFNVADIFIFIGGFIIMVASFKKKNI